MADRGKCEVLFLRQNDAEIVAIAELKSLAAAYIVSDSVSIVSHGSGGVFVESLWPTQYTSTEVEAPHERSEEEIERIATEFASGLDSVKYADEALHTHTQFSKFSDPKGLKTMRKVNVLSPVTSSFTDIDRRISRGNTYLFADDGLRTGGLENLGIADRSIPEIRVRAQEISVAINAITTQYDLSGYGKSELDFLRCRTSPYADQYREAVRGFCRENEGTSDDSNAPELAFELSHHYAQPSVNYIIDRTAENRISKNVTREFMTSPRIVVESLGAFILAELTQHQIEASTIALGAIAVSHLLKSGWDRHQEDLDIKSDPFYLFYCIEETLPQLSEQKRIKSSPSIA